MEQIMVCGFGACYVCVRTFFVNGEKTLKRVCRDGPVFDKAMLGSQAAAVDVACDIARLDPREGISGSTLSAPRFVMRLSAG
jgi:hypothetical protein